MNLEELKNEIKQLKAIAAIDLETITDSRIQYNAQGAKNQAMQKLDKLLPQMVDLLLANSKTLVLVDSLPKKLEGIEEADGAIVLDFLALEKELVNRIFPDYMKAFAFNAHTQDKVNILLFDLFVRKVNVTTMNTMILRADNFEEVSSREAAVKKMHKWLTAAYGDELKTILMRFETIEAAKQKADSDSLTVIVENVPSESVNSLLSLTKQSVILSGTGEEPNSIEVTAETTNEELLGKLKKVFGNKRRK